MPPKRKPVKADETISAATATTTVTPDPQPVVTQSTQDDNSQPSKKQKTITGSFPIYSSFHFYIFKINFCKDSTKSDDKADSDEDDDRPGCMYGSSCYRKNPGELIS